MKFSQLAPALLPLLASQSNAEVGPSYTLKAVQPGSPFHGQPINAHAGTFWIGEPGAAACGLPPIPCPDFETKILATGDHLDTVATPGQAIFVLPNGALAYTPPGDPFPPNVFTSPLQLVPTPFGPGYTFLGGGFSACPTPYGFQVYAINSPGGPFELAAGCIPFDAVAVPPLNPVPVDLYV
ncbi:hypothetical protein BJX96DRAFT_12571 [Aspergillus floccosus]